MNLEKRREQCARALSWRVDGETPAIYCRVCGEKKAIISKALGVCVECIRHNPEASQPHIASAHHQLRMRVGLPPAPPKTKDGIRCSLCANQCSIGKGEKGYCGLRWNDEGLNSIVDPDRGLLYYYLHPHVTNFCARAWRLSSPREKGWRRVGVMVISPWLGAAHRVSPYALVPLPLTDPHLDLLQLRP